MGRWMEDKYIRKTGKNTCSTFFFLVCVLNPELEPWKQSKKRDKKNKNRFKFFFFYLKTKNHYYYLKNCNVGN